MILRFLLVLSVFVTVFISTESFAQDVGESTKLPLPRFASLRGDEVYARTGPGTRYPIQWVYQKKNLPVEITKEFDTWRKIRDVEGEEGWIHQSLLSGKRFVMQITGEHAPLYKTASEESRIIAQTESHAVLSLDSCENGWCYVSSYGYNGWIPLVSLWGVYEGEEIE